MKRNLIMSPVALAFGGLLVATPGLAAGGTSGSSANDMNTGYGTQSYETGATTTGAQPVSSEALDAQALVDEAVTVVTEMKADPKLTKRMKKAKGVFIVPEFGRAAAIVGGHGGEGVMLEHHGGKWSNPAFYNLGGISVGAQAGASGGSIAMLLMTDDAVQQFKQQNSWSLNANAGLSIVDWSANAQASAGKGDIIMWSNTSGLFAGAGISISDVSFDNDESSGFYGKKVTPQQILAGDIGGHKAPLLKESLPG